MTKKLFAVALFCALIFTFGIQTFSKVNRATHYPYVQNERLLPLALREIYDAQNIYQETVGNGNFGSFGSLINAGLLSGTWQTTTYSKYGYIFQIRTTDSVPNVGLAADFSISAIPLKYRRTGRKSFYLNHLGVMRAEDKNGSNPTGNEPVVGNFSYTALPVRTDRRTVDTLRLVHSAQATYQATVGNGNFSSLFDLYVNHLISEALGRNRFGGYNFVVSKTDRTLNTPAYFSATATPTRYNLTGIRSFYIDETGVIRGADKNGESATAQDPPIE